MRVFAIGLGKNYVEFRAAAGKLKAKISRTKFKLNGHIVRLEQTFYLGGRPIAWAGLPRYEKLCYKYNVRMPEPYGVVEITGPLKQHILNTDWRRRNLQ